MSTSRVPIAIVGIGGVFPGARDFEEFWANIVNARSAAREVPEGRWALAREDAYDSEIGARDKVYSLRGCFVTDPPPLDTSALALDDDVLSELDPSIRLLLSAGVQAVEDAACGERDRARTGVIIGNLALPTDRVAELAWDTIGRTIEEKVLGPAGDSGPSVHPLNRYVTGLPAGMLARALRLGGGTLTLDAACASSLYALKLAADELASGKVDVMLGGGLSRPSALYTQMGFSQLRALSPSGVCSPFDAAGDGLVVGEGAGVFVLKRLDDAVRDGNTVYAVVRGIGLSNDIDGGLLAPSSDGQLRAMHAAYDEAGLAPQDIDLIECHATGTPLGDGVEFESLRSLWGSDGWTEGQCVIGSVKSNVGHLLTAAGAAALMKTLLAMKEGVLPPSANFRRAHAGLRLEDSPFRILTTSRPWERRSADTPRRAGVSAFGFGGINAHVVLEEWNAEVASIPVPESRVDTPPRASGAIAVVGLDACFGPWNTLRDVQERLFGADEMREGASPEGGWGAPQSAWYRRRGLLRRSFSGHYIDDLDIPLNAFRIPPKELQEMLPQQLLMLLVSARALKDGNIAEGQRERTGVFIGLGLDLNTTNFMLRWMLPTKARAWAERLGLGQNDREREDWVESLRDACGPALNANRTMGALGSVVASRIAREFRFGGPSFALSSEESSGLRAIDVAARRLQQGDIDAALVGAVDFPGDVRTLLATDALHPSDENDETVRGEGATAVVLKRLEDAERDGDRIYAVVRGAGVASGSTSVGWDGLDGAAYARAMQQAWGEAGATPDAAQFLELNGAEDEDAENDAIRSVLTPDAPDSLTLLGRSKAMLGHTGAASGLAGFLNTCLAIYQETIPGCAGARTDSGRLRYPRETGYWFRSRADGPRRAGVSACSIDGNYVHVAMESYEGSSGSGTRDRERLQPTGVRREGLFFVEANNTEALSAGLARLRSFAEAQDDVAVDTAAREWWRNNREDASKALAVSFVARSTRELREQIDFVSARLNTADGPAHLNDILGQAPPTVRDRVFFSAEPLGVSGEIAFVFPGSGNQYAGMGQDLSVQWPEVFRRQDMENLCLREQFQPGVFWYSESINAVNSNHKATLFGQVALGTASSDLIRRFGIRPSAVIGYSLGETAGLFALKAWTDRDGMLERINASTLFTEDLAGEYRAARKAWKVPAGNTVDWALGVIDRPAKVVRAALQDHKKVYNLIVNTVHECVVGGDPHAVEKLVRKLDCEFFPLQGVTTVHCEVAREVQEPYRALHLLPTAPPKGVRFYSGAWGTAYNVDADTAADSVLAQAIYGIDYPKVIESAYEDGARVFLEMGPGGSCSRMIGEILKGRPHVARSVCMQGRDATTTVLRTLAHLLAERVPVDLSVLYGSETAVRAHQTASRPERSIKVHVGHGPIDVPMPHAPQRRHAPLEPARSVAQVEEKRFVPSATIETPPPPVAPRATEEVAAFPVSTETGLLQAWSNRGTAHAGAHEAFLRWSDSSSRVVAYAADLQLRIAAELEGADVSPASTNEIVAPFPPSTANPVVRVARSMPLAVAMDREACLEFAIGSIAKSLGPQWAEADAYPTRVRLPDEPLMLVDRILSFEGEPRSMSGGRVTTEHDILPGAWYLDGDRIPTCIAVEAGQADLILSAYLGIDAHARGVAMYRLLDAQITFHRALPGPGETIRYDIRIERFFRQGDTHLFRFNFDATVNGELLLTMRNGCAGFFTREELDAGTGIVQTELDRRPLPGTRPDDWTDLVPVEKTSYDDDRLNALRRGDLAGCFGPLFAGLDLAHPVTLPAGRMKLVDRIVDLDPQGGRFGLGIVRGEMDVDPDDWFLTCHFVDDKVMPGTLMYECCLHTLRVYLLRMGWIGEEHSFVYEPVPGVAGQLKCRGEVNRTTSRVTYEVAIKEIGYNPHPYVIADSLMYVDGKPAVEMTNLSLQLTGLTREGLETLWSPHALTITTGEPLFGYDKILAFSQGKPSEAFGEPYRIFDEERAIARLPRPPFQFLDRIVEIDAEPWVMKAGGAIVAEYDVPPEEWYFGANRQGDMPFAVLLEIALQPCGWLAAYMGSALTSDGDLHFRNLGGSAIQHAALGPDAGTLRTRVTSTGVSSSGGMIIQHYTFEVHCNGDLVYQGDTNFGYFSKTALANQVGLREASLYEPSSEETSQVEPFAYPRETPYPSDRLRMVDRVEAYMPQGGPHGLGYLRAAIDVDPEAWFFKAHFYQDPVWPGSLGLEGFLQLMRFLAIERWGGDEDAFVESVALGEEHRWIYRGQVIPADAQVTIEAIVTAVDDDQQLLRADGHLMVDGRIIYRMEHFAVRRVDPSRLQ